MTTETRLGTKSASQPVNWHRRPEPLAATWESRSACYNRPEEWWDGDSEQLTQKARAVCRTCPVLAECLGKTMTDEAQRIWSRTLVRGGLTGKERTQLFLDAREDGAYDAEEARLTALEAAAYGVGTGQVVAEDVSPSTRRLAARLAGEEVPDRKPPSLQEIRGGTAKERALQRIGDIMRWREQGMAAKDIAARLQIGRRTIAEVITAFEAMGAARPDDAEPAEAEDAELIDRFLAGESVELTREQHLAAVAEGTWRGMSYLEIDRVRGIPKDSTSQFVSRARKRYTREGKTFPQMRGRMLFTDEQVVEMRELYAAGGVTDLEIAMRYGAPRNTVSHALNGKNYRHVGGPIREGRALESVRSSRRNFCGHTDSDAPVQAIAQAS
ncbi:WhiB family transcriptional regulator [Streptomyces sp. NPDC060001]|uniref:WhiB family transcriptional regulator n=1 Tax=Streptomyces sp. NPDC060001 TaxID=3347032 RepID=UPI0036893CBF